PSASSVRLRAVVRDDRYAVRLRLDADRLAARNLRPADVVAGLTALRLAPAEDPDVGLAWLTTFGGPRAPRTGEVADTMLPVRGASVRLGDVVTPDGGIERVPRKDERGVELGAQN